MSLFFYNIFLFFFKVGSRIASLFNQKAGKWVAGRKNILRRIADSIDKKDQIVWMHCASLGEFEQGRPVLEKIKSAFPEYKILLTFFSPSGYEVRKNYEGADYVFYLPADSAANAKKFLDLINPALVIFVKYEFWYYYTSEIKNRNIPFILISAVFRTNQAFFKWYGSLYRKMLNNFSHIFVQDGKSEKLLTDLTGYKNVTVAGDTRFDRVKEIASRFEPIPAVGEFASNSNVIVAGSTWPDDEKVLSETFAKLDDPFLKLIVAPHEINDEHLKQIKKLFPQSIFYSEFKSIDRKNSIKNPVLIIDSVGILSRLYHYATITYIGGGFTKDGIHNSLEAAVYAKPVLFGPNYQKYREAVELITEKGAMSFTVTEELQQLILSLLNNEEINKEVSEAAGTYVNNNVGATEKIVDYIQANRLLTN